MNDQNPQRREPTDTRPVRDIRPLNAHERNAAREWIRKIRLDVYGTTDRAPKRPSPRRKPPKDWR